MRRRLGSCFSDSAIILDSFPTWEIKPRVKEGDVNDESTTVDLALSRECISTIATDDDVTGLFSFPLTESIPSITVDDGDHELLFDKVVSFSRSIPSIAINDDVKELLFNLETPALESIPSITFEDEDFEAASSAVANHDLNLPTYLNAVLEEVLNDATLPETNSTPSIPAENAASGGGCDRDDSFTTIHECKICESKFDFRSDLLKHYRSHERDKKSMICSHCNTRFHSTVELLIHRKQDEKCSGAAKGVSAPTNIVRRRRNR